MCTDVAEEATSNPARKYRSRQRILMLNARDRHTERLKDNRARERDARARRCGGRGDWWCRIRILGRGRDA